MDKDSGSIGGLRKPPPVTRKLYYASMVCDITGLMLSLLIGFKMLLMMLVYVGVSKAYSWKRIRLKKYPWFGWIVVILFQGGYTFLLVNMASENLFESSWFTGKNIACMFIASLLIGSYYPLTQIYQHEEDSRRGDYTISYRLGITGTFIFSGILFFLSCTIAFFYFQTYYNFKHFVIFISCLLPTVFYFFYWLIKTTGDKKFADYDHTMRMTFISSACMIICFSILFFINYR